MSRFSMEDIERGVRGQGPVDRELLRRKKKPIPPNPATEPLGQNQPKRLEKAKERMEEAMAGAMKGKRLRRMANKVLA